MPVFKFISIGIFIMISISCTHAGPFIPKDGSSVLEQVEKHTDKDLQEISQLADQVKKAPENIDLTLQLFNRYLNHARKTGDPYYSGMAEASLQKWLSGSDIPHPVRIARATIKQYNHDFEAALNDLNFVLQKKPGNVQARLLRANIFRIQGKYSKAREDCYSLTLLTDPKAVAICGLSVSSLTGKANWSADKLQAMLRNTETPLSEDLKKWASIVLAEILSSMGENEKALTHLQREVKANSRTDIYTKAVLMDLLLLEKKYQEAHDVVSELKLPDAILLRKAIAAKKMNHPDAKKLTAIIRSRFMDTKKAGRPQHLREEALYELHLNDNPDQALALSINNWKKQRELLDTRIVLEAALTAGKNAEASPVINWIEKQGTEDVYIRKLIRELKE